MLYSSQRKQALSGWLKVKDNKTFNSPLKLQKFLFFYEASEKVLGHNHDFSKLRGYTNGPVFSDVYGDYNYCNDEFVKVSEQEYLSNNITINDYSSKFAYFIICIHNEYELSRLTHEFNIWKAKEKKIIEGALQLSLDQQDFNINDQNLIKILHEAYPEEYLNSVEIFTTFNKSFVVQKDDLDKLPEDFREILNDLAWDENLQNPVYISIDDDGGVLLD